MRIIKFITIFTLIFSRLFGEIPLNNQWLFHVGDDTSWYAIDCVDSTWIEINVPDYWEDSGFEKYDGFGWYRQHFSVDSVTLAEKDSLFLMLGYIDDCDETFLNGKLIGATGKFHPEFSTGKTDQRVYFVPDSLLQIQNTLAIRVYDNGESGGLYKGQCKIFTHKEIETIQKTKNIPHNSISRLSFTNGIAAANYNIEKVEFDHFFPHIYKQYDELSETPMLIQNANPLLYYKGKKIPLTELKTVQSGYINSTGIIKHVLQGNGVALTLYAFCPFTETRAVWTIYTIIEADDLENYTLNFAIHGKDNSIEIGKWSYQSQNRKWLTVHLHYTKKGGDEKTFLKRYNNKHPGYSALVKEIKWWKEWHAKTQLPDDITPDQKELYLQSLAILKMAQCREEFPSRGQIIASLPPAKYNRAYIQDQAYSISALLHSGHTDEAQSALQFLMNGRTGKYTHFMWYGNKYGVGRDYAVSVSRYFGNGMEDSKHNKNGPSISLSGFGLTLSNMRHYIQLTDDIKFLKYYWEKVTQLVADVLINSVDETGLIKADSGPWKRNLPGQHYLYTSVTAYKGLLDASWLARRLNEDFLAEKYENCANGIRINIEEKLVYAKKNIVKGKLEGGVVEKYIDGSCVEALNWIFTPQDEFSSQCLRTFNEFLTMENNPEGYHRILDGTWFDRQENIFLDLRLAAALQKMISFNKADSLLKWVVDQAKNNYYVIPEFYDEKSADYEGAFPMCGQGAGAYILTFWRDY